MRKHTPGPWKFTNFNWRGEEDTKGNLYVTGWHGEGTCTSVCRVEGNATSHDVTLANARLIAAAPDLLVACEQAYSLIGTQYVGPSLEVSLMLCKAIAKAKGES